MMKRQRSLNEFLSKRPKEMNEGEPRIFTGTASVQMTEVVMNINDKPDSASQAFVLKQAPKR